MYRRFIAKHGHFSLVQIFAKFIGKTNIETLQSMDGNLENCKVFVYGVVENFNIFVLGIKSAATFSPL